MKKIKQIQQISIQRMNNGAHCQFLSATLGVAEEYPAAAAKFQPFVEKLQAAYDRETGAQLVSRKSEVVEKYKSLDTTFNHYFRAYKKFISSYKTLSEKDMSDAAEMLEQQLKEFHIRIKDKQANKLGLIKNWVVHLEENYATQVALLNMQTFVAKVREISFQMDSLFMERTDELTELQLGALQSARNKSDDAYREMVRMVNALAVVEGDELYSDFIDLMNVYIKSYKLHVLKQTVSKKRKTPVKTEDIVGEED